MVLIGDNHSIDMQGHPMQPNCLFVLVLFISPIGEMQGGENLTSSTRGGGGDMPRCKERTRKTQTKVEGKRN